ncbi:MAG: HAD family phosphatase [Lachnospiraceae bacterium]|jgi:epoxide hydrolase-like predicted phosphatase|nr:HAD family phosphatase [Lachnospiraceae bacterium]
MEKRKIDTVIFDIGGVLTDYHTLDYFLGKGCTPEMAARLKAATMETPAWSEYDRGVLNDEEVRALFKQNDPEIAEEIDRTLTSMTGMVTKREGSVPWIRELQGRGLKVLVLSNFSETALRDCADALDFLKIVDGGIISCKEKLIKPDGAIYQLIIRRYGLDPARSVFIDDTQKNLDGAAIYAMRTIHFETEAQTRAELEPLISGR